MIMKAKRIRGPYLWYAGYPALIRYSLQYDKRQITGLEELDTRVKELTHDRQDIINTIEALDDSMEDPSHPMTAVVIKLLEDGKRRLESRYQAITQELQYVTLARNEWVIMTKTRQAEK